MFSASGTTPTGAISIDASGAKGNVPLSARICRAIGVPFVVVQDSDVHPGRKTVAAELALNALIADATNGERRGVLEPDL